MSTGRKTDRGLDDQGKQIRIFQARAPRHSSSEMCPKEREHCFWQLSISESPSVEENKARGDDKSACAYAQALTCCTCAHTHTHTDANTNVSLLPHHTQIRWVCPNHMCWAPSGELICCGLIPTSWWNLFGKGGLSSLIFCELARTRQTIMNITDLILQDLISTRDCGSQYFLSAHPESFYLLLVSTGIARAPS